MTLKKNTGFRRPAATAVIIVVFLAIASWAVRAGQLHQPLSHQKRPKQHPVMVAQSENRTMTGEKTAPLSESSASESKPQEKEESDEARERPLEAFRPSETIEAEQAVDFPYDI